MANLPRRSLRVGGSRRSSVSPETNPGASAITTRWPTLLPTAATAHTPATDVRPDKALGFGPPPNTSAAAETFNQLANAINLLTRYRVMLPGAIEFRALAAQASREVTGYLAVNNRARGSGRSTSPTGLGSVQK